MSSGGPNTDQVQRCRWMVGIDVGLKNLDTVTYPNQQDQTSHNGG